MYNATCSSISSKYIIGEIIIQVDRSDNSVHVSVIYVVEDEGGC